MGDAGGLKAIFAVENPPRSGKGGKPRQCDPITLPYTMDFNPFSNNFPGFGDFFRRNIGKFPMSIELLAAGIAFADPATPAWAKAVLATAIAYVLCPLDAVPDFIPVAGWIDDIGVLGGALTGVARSCITDDHRRKAREILGLD